MKGISVLITTVGFMSQYIRAQQLSDCPSGRLEVVENSNSFSLTCSGYSGTVTWSLQSPGGVPLLSIGTCSSSCQLNPDLPPGYFSLTSQSSSSSRMTSRATTRPTSDGETTYICGNQATSSSCSADILYPAEVSGCSVKLQEISGTLTVTGSCDVTKVFSSGGNYKCHWFRGDSQSQTVSVRETTYSVTSHSDSNYRKGTCTFSSTDLPTGSGSYYYRVVISPGNTQKSVGSISITEPSTPTISCTPPDWVPANTQLSCTCTTTNIGQPNGRLQWVWVHDGSVLASGTEGATTLTLPPQTVKQGDHGNTRAQFKCRVEWYRDDPPVTHTARVAWGPGDVSVPQDRTFETDSEGSRDLSLTCNPQSVNPGANLMTYNWTGRCQGNTDNTCTIRPHPPDDDGLETTCTVTNTYNNNMQRHDTYRLNLNYPPLSPPVIRGYTQPLYDNDHLSLTCEVSGGQPLVNSVTFACSPRHPDNQTDVTGQESVSSSLNMIASKDDNGVTCTCGAEWKVDNYYRLTNSINITVFYPPTKPTISAAAGFPYPFVAGDEVGGRLTCSSTTPGNPQADYVWLSNAGGQAGTDSGSAILTFNTLTPDHNGRQVTCRAKNRFTEDKNQPVDNTTILQVYYPLTISVESLDVSTECHVTSDVRRCVVPEGQRIHINCKAVSNPPPATFVWRLGDRHLGHDSTLFIPSADRDLNTGDYSCSVTSGDLSEGRGRWVSTYNISIFVTYPTAETHLTLNSQPHNLTVNENDTVLMTCRADGRPTPKMELINTDSRQIQNTTNGGQLVMADRDSWLNHTLSATCQHTGNYRCTAGNGGSDGAPATADGMLFVNCKPRRKKTNPVLSINYQGTPVQLPVDIVSYPVPNRFHFTYLGVHENVANNTIVHHSRLIVACLPTQVLCIATCIITVSNMSDSDAGFYAVTIGNAYGDSDVRFRVLVNENGLAGPGATDGGADGGLSTGAAVAVTLLVTIIVVVVVMVTAFIVWAWRRHWVLPCADRGVSTGMSDDVIRGQVMGLNSIEGNASAERTAPSEYEELKTREVGLTSQYSTLEAYANAESGRQKDHVYENSASSAYVNVALDK